MFSPQQPVGSGELGFSLAERDRRWTRVRSLMEAAGIEILVVSREADLHYLTQIGHPPGAAVFPLADEVTVFNEAAEPQGASPWLTDLRPSGHSWAASVAERLGELQADGKIVGITGLDGLLALPDGDLNYNSFVTLRESFPHIRWVGVSSLMREARHLKSDEEMAFLARAAAATDAGFGAIAQHLQPGVSDRELWGRVVLSMAQAAGDPPRRVDIVLHAPGASPPPGGRPLGRVARAGTTGHAVAAGRYAGYEAEGVQPLAVGGLPERWREAWKVHLEAWHRTWELLRPGVPHAALIRVAESASSGPFRAHQALRGQGLGDDLPVVPRRPFVHEMLEAPVLSEGACFVLSPSVGWSEDGAERRLTWGDTIQVTAQGPRRLGIRPQEIIVCD